MTILPFLQDNEGVTPLMVAISKCHVDIVRLFVQRGAAMALRDNRGRTAEDYAHRVASHKILVSWFNMTLEGIWWKVVV